MAKGSGTMRVIEPGVRTVAAQGTSDWFVPGWDKMAGSAQHLERVEKRAAMGQKKTPIGAGVLRKGK